MSFPSVPALRSYAQLKPSQLTCKCLDCMLPFLEAGTLFAIFLSQHASPQFQKRSVLKELLFHMPMPSGGLDREDATLIFGFSAGYVLFLSLMRYFLHSGILSCLFTLTKGKALAQYQTALGLPVISASASVAPLLLSWFSLYSKAHPTISQPYS